MRLKSIWGAALLALAVGADAADETLMIGRFSAGDLTGWETKSFQGETRYAFDGKSGQRALFADSRGTASGLYREIRVDLKRTPFLNWSWRVDRVLDGVDERGKAGDDYPARRSGRPVRWCMSGPAASRWARPGTMPLPATPG